MLSILRKKLLKDCAHCEKKILWAELSTHLALTYHPDCLNEEIRVCEHCHHQVEMLGEDGIDHCTNGCGCVEGCNNFYVTQEEYEKMGDMS